MLFLPLILFTFISGGHLACSRRLLLNDEESQNQQVFVDDGEANSFLGRHLLLNQFDFEMFVPGNLERECYEEICNYEEAREVFENIPQTDNFWKKYTEDQTQNSSRIDVVSLLVGVVCGAIAIFVLGYLVWFFCRRKSKGGSSRRSSIRARPRRSNAAIVMQRLEADPLHPGSPPMLPAEPPSYEQATAAPPPYPGSRPGSARR